MRRTRTQNLLHEITEDQLGENIRTLCDVMGWQMYWVRHLFNSHRGILDLRLVPTRHVERRHILDRELKGFDSRGRLGTLSDEQAHNIQITNAAGGDAALWVPADWFSERIIQELR